jgi:WD40 repeat protein
MQYLPNPPERGGGVSSVINVWKIADQTRREVFAPWQQGLATFCWLPDDKRLVLGLEAQAGIWDPESLRFAAYTPRVGVFARALAVSSRDQTLAVGYLNGSVKLYRLPAVTALADAKEPLTLEHLADLDKHPTSIDFVQFTPDGKTLVSSSFGDRSVWIWDVAAKAPRHRVQGWHIALSPDGLKLATAGGAAPRHAAVVWNVKTGEALLRCQAPDDEDLSGLAFTPDGQFLLAPAGGTNLLVWKMDGK